jgi:hypothetical protein
MLAGFLIENYVLAFIGLRKEHYSRVGIVKRHGRCAPYQVAVLVDLEDVEGGNQVFNLPSQMRIRLPRESGTP